MTSYKLETVTRKCSITNCYFIKNSLWRRYFPVNFEIFKIPVLYWLLLNRAPTSTQLHPPPPSSFQPLPSSLQYPQHY